jgi:hypothetical protein
MKFARLAFALSFLALTTQVAPTTQAVAQTLCKPGSEVACTTLLGKPGTKKCIGDGEFDACVATPPRPAPPAPPVSGIVFGKYLVLTVIYAPPGTTAPQTTTGEQSFGQVSYEADSTTGSTKTNTKSFKQDYQVSVKLDCLADLCYFNGGASFEYTRNTTNSNAININKKTTSVITDPGPVEDTVDHNFDQVWLFLHPKYDVTVSGTQITWALDADQSAGLVQYAYAGWLTDPSKIPPGVLQDFQAAGITPADYQVILAADPLAQCSPPVAKQLQSQPAIARPPLPVVCSTPLPSSPRYVPANINLPYDPPYAPGNPVPLQTYSIDNSMTDTTTKTTENDYAESVTASYSGLTFLDLFTVTLSTQDTWTEQDISQTQTQTGTEQKSTLVMGGPAYGYTGPVNMDVYYDTLYMTFAFVPNELSSDALQGTVSSSQGKPVVGQLVTATSGGKKYRTYTNAKGEYHFSKQFTGPIDLQAGSTALHLPAPEAGKSVALRLQ